MPEPRKQFTFYESFARAIRRIRSKEDRADAYDAICDFALYGIEPDIDNLPDSVAIAFDLIRPVLEKAAIKARIGRNGGKANRKQIESKSGVSEKQTRSKAEANRKQTESKPEAEGEGEKEREKEKEVEKEIEKDILSSDEDKNNKAVVVIEKPPNAVLSAYCNRIQPMPSTACIAELCGYQEQFGDEMCLRAIDIAVDAGVRNWRYTRAILQRWQQSGYKTLADVDRAEAERNKRKGVPVDNTDHNAWMDEYI